MTESVSAEEFARTTCHGRWMGSGSTPGLVTVIIPTYNRAHLVAEAMDSVLAQDYRPIEMLVIDDGSTDGTQEAVGQWLRQRVSSPGFTVRLLTQEHLGAQAARNLGLVESAGEYIQFLDSDDLLLAGKIALQEAVLRAQRSRPCCYCITEERDAAGALRGRVGQPPSNDRLLCAARRDYNCMSPLWRRQVIHACGPCDESLVCLQNWVFAARIITRFGPGAFLPQALCVHRFHGGERISALPPAVFAHGVRVATREVHCIIATSGRRSRLAENTLAGALVSAFRGMARAGQLRDAREVLGEAWRLAHGSRKAKVAAVLTLWALFGDAPVRTICAAKH